MNKDIDRETYEMLLKSLEHLKEDAEKMRQKREAKLWGDIEVPISLSDALSRLPKDEITQIRQNLGIKRVSALKNQELIAELQRLIPEEVEKIFLLFDDDRYRLAKKIFEKGGFAVCVNPEPGQVEYLLNRGIAFPGVRGGQKALVMPQEIASVFKRINVAGYQRRVRRNTGLIRLTQGLLYYYGTLNINQLKEMLEKHTEEEIDVVQYIDLLHEAASYYEEIRPDSAGFSNIRVFDSQRVKMEHEKRPDINYYPFTKKELFQAGEPGFVDRNSAYIEFVKFILENYEISREEADSITEECVYAVRIGESLKNIVEYLQSRLEINTFDMLQAFSEKIIHLMNNTRQWFLKGHTPEELLPSEKIHLKPPPVDSPEVIDIRTGRKIGRNDPCPCGSGKKFKKCCGR
ncbi:MAG: SEC-C metal-binding domain-containing protein [Firmicutes bacterium]|nr:SEC-C metal-binding domain-containing protein [Bacillota bacterium]